jgi:hypothetical protein
MFQNVDKKAPKSAKNFFCEKCDFICSKSNGMTRHLATDKHQMLTNVDTESAKSATPLFECDCGKVYQHRQSLSLHRKKCPKNNFSDYLVLEIIKQNKELISQNQELQKHNNESQKQILEALKCGTNTTINNTISNSNNKTFNLQLFLNETCKDAMNIMDFVDSIKFQLSDLESVGKLGYINGISNIIIRNLKALDENMRPVHCSDLKREKIYVKDADKWAKEGDDNKILKNAIRYIAHKNVKMIPAFREKYPDCIYSESRKSDQYNRLIIEAMGGDGNDEDGKANKIIKRIAKEVLIEK